MGFTWLHLTKQEVLDGKRERKLYTVKSIRNSQILLQDMKKNKTNKAKQLSGCHSKEELTLWLE